MAADVTLHFEAGDIERIKALFARFQRETGKDMQDAVRWMSYYVLASVSASTSQAPKKRKVYANPGTKAWPQRDFPWYVDVWKRGKVSEFYIPRDEGRDAKIRTIKRRGLAKSSWLWASADLGKRVKTPQPRMAGVASGVFKQSALDPKAIITNRLEYLMKALKGSGPQAINSAMTRAANRAEANLEKRLATLAARS